jgi:putative oxidoreductase
MDILFLISRFLFGGYLLWGGLNHFRQREAMESYAKMKHVPSPHLAVQGTGALLLVAGIGIILGIYVPIAIFALVVFLVPVTLLMHDFWNITDPVQKMQETVMFAKNAALLGAALAYLFVPLPWPLSLLSF